jgi:hypothetical protein
MSFSVWLRENHPDVRLPIQASLMDFYVNEYIKDIVSGAKWMAQEDEQDPGNYFARILNQK